MRATIFPKSDDPILSGLYDKLRELDAAMIETEAAINQRMRQLQAEFWANDPEAVEFARRMYAAKTDTDAYAESIRQAQAEAQQERERRAALDNERRQRQRAAW